MKSVLKACVLGLAAAALASCPMDLRSYVEVLQIRDALGPIAEITVKSAGDFIMMGEIPTETRQDITYDFMISKYEITNGQFQKFIDDGGYTTQSYWTTNGWNWRSSALPPITQPQNWTDPIFNGSSQPVVGVSWYEAVAFCNWRSVKERQAPAYDSSGKANLAATGYRLPTEVEWEYAAAKGAAGQAERTYAYGVPWDPSRVICSGAFRTANVGSKSPSGDTPQGLSDMTGNVSEWCGDNPQAPMPATDRYVFVSDATASSFVIRGGSWNDALDPWGRCASGKSLTAPSRNETAMLTVGFRTARRQ